MKTNKFILLGLFFLFGAASVSAMNKGSFPSRNRNIYIDSNGLTPHNEESSQSPSWGRNPQGLWVLYDNNGHAIRILDLRESKERDKLLGITTVRFQ